MSKTLLLKRIFERLRNEGVSVSKLEVYAFLEAFPKVLAEYLKEGKSVKLRGFGSFYLKREKRRTYDFKKGSFGWIEKERVAFRASRRLKDYLKG